MKTVRGRIDANLDIEEKRKMKKNEQGQSRPKAVQPAQPFSYQANQAAKRPSRQQPASNQPPITTARQPSKPTIQQTSSPRPANRKPAPAITQSVNKPSSQPSQGHRSHRTTNPPPSKGKQSREVGLFEDHEAKCTRRNGTNSMQIRVAGCLLAGNQEASPWSLRRLGSPALSCDKGIEVPR